MKKALTAAVVVLVLGAAVGAALALRPGQSRSYEGGGLSLDYPAAWKIEVSDRPRLRRLTLSPGSGPVLSIEERRAKGADPSAYLKALGEAEPGAGTLRLGGREAYAATLRLRGSVEVEDAAARSAPARRRRYYVIAAGEGLFIASYELPRSAWARWRLDRQARRILSSLKTP